MSKEEKTFKEVMEKIKKYRDERDWKQFHSPKNLSMAINTEASELSHHFLWETLEESRKKVKEEGKVLQEIKDELGDVLINSFLMADSIGADVAEIIEEKLEKSKKKYPVDEFKGKAKKFSENKDNSK